MARGGAPERIDGASAAKLMPLHLLLDSGACIRSAGPTFSRLPAGNIVGQDFFTVFDVRRPFRAGSMEELRCAAAGTLQIALRRDPSTCFRGHGVPMERDGLLLNFGFGLSVVEAVERFGLTAQDFPPTESTVELLYVVEATTTAMAETRKLADRLRAGKSRAESKAKTDALTGLGNRRAMSLALAQAAAREDAFAVMQIDLDHFKEVNDMHGHAAGDCVLLAVANRLRAIMRRRDRIFRPGGDEFAVLLRDKITEDDLAPLADRVIREIERPVETIEAVCRVSASIGIAIRSAESLIDPSALLVEADRALYRSKADGRGRPTFAN